MSEFNVSIDFIKQIKKQIIATRYHIAKVANAELLKLYFAIGMAIDKQFENHKWGAKILDTLSEGLQQELPGLRGFSAANMKKMRVFYQAWNTFDLIWSSVTTKLDNSKNKNNLAIAATRNDIDINNFFSVSFTHHYEILLKIKDQNYRWYYINKTVQEFWSVRHLRNEIKNQSHKQVEKLPNNFKNALEPSLSNKAMQTFKDQYLLDFINVEEPDEEIDERVLEHEIVRNIKKFLMSLGSGFSFIGNQYRLIVEEEEYFIDLLFFHRGLQSLVAFELKKGKFKPEYVGKMNFYLSALDDLIKQPHENSSIGIILCKEKENKKVEYSFRDFSKPMGVSVFKTTETLPDRFKKALPSPEELKRLLD